MIYILPAIIFLLVTKLLIGGLCIRFLKGVNAKISPEKYWEDAIIFGWSIFAYVLYIAPRFGISKYYSYVVLILIVAFSLFVNLKSNIEMIANIFKKIPYALLAPSVIILLAPYFLNNSIFYQNWGPDLDGNLISSGYLNAGNNFLNLVQEYLKVPGVASWWFSDRTAPWKIADQAIGISVEFFLRSIRWAHAVEGNFINNIFQMPIWFGLLSMMLLSGFLSTFLLFKKCIDIGSGYLHSLLFALIFGFSQSFILMAYEGINVQLIYAPIFLYLVFNIDAVFESNLYKQVAITSGLLLMAIGFGEGVQLFGAVLIVYFFTILTRVNFNIFLRYILITILISMVIFPTITFDYLMWNIARINDGMMGGALHYDFDILNIISGMPYFSTPKMAGLGAIKPFHNASTTYNLSAALFLGVAVIFFRKYTQNYKLILSILIVGIVVILTGHKYALWKYFVLFQPVLLLYISSKFLSSNKRIVTIVLGIMLSLNLLYVVKTIHGYSKITRPVKASQFDISNIEGCYAVVTPSASSVYYRLGTTGQLKLLHEADRQYGLRPNFSRSEAISCIVAAYFDCDAEGMNFCKTQLEANGMRPNIVYKTKYELNDVVDENGLIKNGAYSRIKDEIFEWQSRK